MVCADVSRRRFLQSGTVALGSLVVVGPLLRFDAERGPRPEQGVGPIAPVADLTTGLPLLKLPEGFTYQSFGWTGDPMDDGTLTPDRHDGMAVVEVIGRGPGREIVLIRNHERGPRRPATRCPWSAAAPRRCTTGSSCRA